ncbi:MAG: phage tail protein [Luteolibacter sp.]
MASQPVISQIQIFAFDFAPRNWALCNGQLLPINQNQALFSLLGTTYGGNGTTTFGLPDLRSRMPKHFGQSAGTSGYVLGQASGSENVTLLSTQMPSHTHAITTTASQPCQSAVGSFDAPEGKFPASHESANIYSTAKNAALGAPVFNTTIGAAGGSQPHPNMPPYLAMNFCIAVQGIFPSRN